MKHPEVYCDCSSSAGPMALRWRCPDCGKTAIIRVTTLATVCDGETVRKAEPQPEAKNST
jgi:predicted RNA-binding Zn-ribbon protein involved in translation (DUF1610 family)